LGGNGSGVSNFIAITLCSLVSAAQKEKKKNDKQRGTKRDKEEKNYNWKLLGNKKKDSSSISILKSLVGSLIIVPLGGLVISLLYRFSLHSGTYDNNHFLEQRRRIVATIAPIITKMGCNSLA